jgi:hypothetical protein
VGVTRQQPSGCCGAMWYPWGMPWELAWGVVCFQAVMLQLPGLSLQAWG